MAQTLSLVGLTLAIAYTLGELVPKRFALQRSQTVALVVGATPGQVRDAARGSTSAQSREAATHGDLVIAAS